MANNWYSKDDWYSPLQSVPTVNAVTPKEKKKNKKVRIIGRINRSRKCPTWAGIGSRLSSEMRRWFRG